MAIDPDEDFAQHYRVLGAGIVVVHAVQTEGPASSPFAKVLRDVCPNFVVLYDPHIACVREVRLIMCVWWFAY